MWKQRVMWRNQSHRWGKPDLRPKRLPAIWMICFGIASRFVRRTTQPRAFSASSLSFSTVFQLRAVFGTPIHLSKRTASVDCEKPFGVLM